MEEAELEVLRQEIKNQGDEIRQLKEQKADPAVIKEKVARMLEKKKKLEESGQPLTQSYKFVLKCPKGTRDYGPKAMAVRESVLKIVTDVFKSHGAEMIETPVFELRDVLLGKYGEEGGKLVYDLQDQGGELLSLRYDLTDFDIAGKYDPMLPEAECLKILDQVLHKLDLGEYVIKLNHRLMLEGMLDVVGATDFKGVCSSVDKLDKEPWAKVEEELIKERGLTKEAAQQLASFVRYREVNADSSNEDLLKGMMQIPELQSNKKFAKGVEEITLLLEFCAHFEVSPSLQVEPSLARGLDYYTGPIFEAVISAGLEGIKDEEGLPVGVGSVAGGGRYDNLVGMFSPKTTVPCCGISFGIERLFAILEAKAAVQEQQIRTSATEVLVASAQKNLLRERMKMCSQLWEWGFKAEIFPKVNPKLLNQLQYAEERLIPLVLIVGESELKAGVVKIRNVQSRIEKEAKLEELESSLKQILSDDS